MSSITLHISLACLWNINVLCGIKYIRRKMLRQKSLKIFIPKHSSMSWEIFGQFPLSRREQIKNWSWQTSKGSALKIMIFQEVHKAIKLYIFSAQINEIPILLCYKPELQSCTPYSVLLPCPQKPSSRIGLCPFAVLSLFCPSLHCLRFVSLQSATKINLHFIYSVQKETLPGLFFPAFRFCLLSV